MMKAMPKSLAMINTFLDDFRNNPPNMHPIMAPMGIDRKSDMLSGLLGLEVPYNGT